MRSRDEIIDEDDFFKDTRMSFGEHLEVLRLHLWRAIWGVVFFMGIGFVLDLVGEALGTPSLGIGRPLFRIIEEPVKVALREFYDKRRDNLLKEAQTPETTAAKALAPQPVRIRLTRDALGPIRGMSADQVPEESIEVQALMNPLDVSDAARRVDSIIYPRELTTLSAQEGFMMYFKVSLVAGLVLASPWVFWQIWSFVAAGLYPHEKRYVHQYLPISTGLFIIGVLLCQFVVMPRTVSALLWFNDFIGVTPDLRLSEWMSLAILLPVIFGVSFQTPLVMLFVERLGLVDAAWFRKKRKYAIFALACFAALITPTPDAPTMCFLWVPMCLLYEAGILLCAYAPGGRRRLDELDVPETEELIEV